MLPGLHPGHTGELAWTVDPTMTITLGRVPEATVFSTPFLIMLMERAAREALRPFLEPGEESVGVEVNIEHLGPALLGDVVRATARVTRVEGRRVAFEVQAWNGPREIGRGTHGRAVVTVQRILENVGKLRTNPAPAATPAGPGGTLPDLTTLRVSVEQRVATVTFDRPSVLNAVDRRMTAEWEQVLGWLATHPEEIRVVLITGQGEAFCAGDDVRELPALSVDEARDLSLRQARLWLACERLPQVFIAAVNGAALGAGCVAAYSCDFRIASHAATFGMPEIRLGWPPSYGVAQLTALVGKARALELCLLGEPISATRALEWGLVHEVVPATQLLPRARQLAERLLHQPAEALRATKRLIHADEGQVPKVTHRADTDAYVRCLALPDAREGLAAFAEKRAPRFTGR
jgi:enoyl-CoA hydratase/carnithine racemase/predicted thioesterase